MAISNKARYFEDMILEGPGQKEYEQRVFEEERTKKFPIYPEGYRKFDGQTVIVTGAAGGQGELEAKLFAQQGANTVILDLPEQKSELLRVADAIKADGGEVFTYLMDVVDVDAWEKMTSEVAAKYGSIDVVVNNAGVIQNATMMEETKESMERLMDVDVWGVFNGMKACVPYMTEAGGGAIVNTCSIQGAHFGPEGLFAYATAKAAVMGMSRAASSELAKFNIRVNTVHPGTILTPMTFPRRANRKSLADGAAMKRFGLSEEVASAVLFLASDDASYITGQGIYLDGGTSTYLYLPTATLGENRD